MVEELYASHYDELLYYCGNLDRAAAEDLVQETYIRALTHLEDLLILDQDIAFFLSLGRHDDAFLDQISHL